MTQEILTVSVSQLNNYIKRVLDANGYLSDIWVKGELSNFKLHSSGHIYASLKDEGSLIKLVMFRSDAQKLTFRPDNGMKVSVRGRISVYERDGIYQLYATDILPDGVGALYKAYEDLKAKLNSEGLFEPSLKKTLPSFPERIGVVTAIGGAALRDILNITKRRYPLAEIVLAPVSVQGISAAPEISAAIDFLNRHNLCDVIITGRGGGSIEDLWAFNEELVARAIFNSKIPVVSAVGHETDFTIADFVSDLRAPTPSAAAELVCPSQDELNSFLVRSNGRLKTALIHSLDTKRQKLKKLVTSYGFMHFKDRINDEKQYVDTLIKNTEKAFISIVDKKRVTLSNHIARLDALSPLKTLSRGYSIALDTESGKVISSVKNINKDKTFTLRLKDGDEHCKFI